MSYQRAQRAETRRFLPHRPDFLTCAVRRWCTHFYILAFRSCSCLVVDSGCIHNRVRHESILACNVACVGGHSRHSRRVTVNILYSINQDVSLHPRLLWPSGYGIGYMTPPCALDTLHALTGHARSYESSHMSQAPEHNIVMCVAVVVAPR